MINAPVGGTLDFGARGTDSVNAFRMAQQATGGDLYVDLGVSAAADVRIIGDPHAISLNSQENAGYGSKMTDSPSSRVGSPKTMAPRCKFAATMRASIGL